MYVYFAPKEVTPENIRRTFKGQEQKDYPNRSMDHLDQPRYFGGLCRPGRESFKLAVENAEIGTTLVLWNWRCVDVGFDELGELLGSRKHDQVIVRILHPKLTLDPLKPEILPLLESLDQTHQMGVEQQKQKSRTPIEPKHKIKITRHLFTQKIPYSTIQQIRHMRANHVPAQKVADTLGVSRRSVTNYTKGVDLDRYKELAEKSASWVPDYKPKENNVFALESVKIPHVSAQSETHQVMVDFLHSHRSESTKLNYWRAWRYFLDFYLKNRGIPLVDWNNINRSDILAYRDHISSGTYARTTVVHKWTPLVSFYTFLVNEGVVKRNLFKNVRIQVADKNYVSVRPFDKTELSNILEELIRRKRRAQKLGHRNREYKMHRYFITFLILARTGCRIGAAVKIEKRDFVRKPKESKLYLSEKKNSLHFVPIDDDLADHVAAYLSKWHEIEPPNYRFLAPEKSPEQAQRAALSMLKRVLDHLNIRGGKIGCHSFRATFATQCYLAGMPVEKIKVWLNHKSVDQTMQYIRFVMPPEAQEWMPKIFDSDVELMNEKAHSRTPDEILPTPSMKVEIDRKILERY